MLHFLQNLNSTYCPLFPQDLIECHVVAVIRHVVVPGFLNFGRRGLLAVVVDWGLLGGMWCLVEIAKSPGFLEVSFICDSGLSSGWSRTEKKEEALMKILLRFISFIFRHFRTQTNSLEWNTDTPPFNLHSTSRYTAFQQQENFAKSTIAFARP